MAWWDHEDLKSRGSKSDRYKLTFQQDYSQDELVRAAKRVLSSGNAGESLKDKAKKILENLAKG